MGDTLHRILKDCPNKSEIIGSIEKLSHLDEFSSALRNYFSERVNETQKLTTLYQQCMQDKFKVETECSSVKKDLADTAKTSEQQQLQIETLTNNLNEATSKEHAAKVELEKKYELAQNTLQQEYELLKHTNNLLIGEKNELLGIINRKDIHIQQLDEQWKENVDKLRRANAVKSELQAKLDEYTQNGTLNEWKKKLVTQQSEIYENTVKQHLETISNQSTELIKLRKTVNNLNANVQTLEDQKSTEINHLNDTVATLRKHLENMQDNYKKLIDKASHNESLMNMEKLELEKELNSSNRLRELLGDEKNHLTDTISRHREIQNELVVKVNQLEKENSQLMTSFNENSKLWGDNAEQYESKIKCLEDELTVAQTIVESSRIEDGSQLLLDNSNDSFVSPMRRVSCGMTESAFNKMLSPMAQSTSQLLKKGLTITQIYTNYNKAQATIQELKDDISKMALQLEINTNQLQTTKSDYEMLAEEKNRCELYADHLSKNLIQVNTAISEMEVKVSTLESENAALLEQKLSLTHVTQDLSTQIRHLLHSTDSSIVGDTHYTTSGVNSDGNNMLLELKLDLDDDDDVDTTTVESLLVFKTVEQLQSQNMKLLTLCRSLKQKIDLLTTNPKTVHHYEMKLGEAADRIGALSEQLDAANRSYETTKKQLEIFMVVNKSNSIVGMGDASHVESGVDTLNNSRSFEAVREQYNQMISSKVELLNEARLEVSRLNDHSNFLQSRITQLETQLTQLDEQRSHTIATLEHEMKEYRLKGEKFVQIDLLNKQLKENIHFYKNNYEEVSEKVNNLEQAHRALSDENSHLRETSKFLESQLQSQSSQTNNFGQLLSCVQDIQNSLEYRENSSGIKMMTFIDEMKDEIKTLRFQLKEAQENTDVRYHTDIQSLRLELKSKEGTISTLLKSESDLLEKLNNVKETTAQAVHTTANTTNDATSIETTRRLTDQLSEYKKQVEQLLVVSAAAEENLEKNVNVWNECKQNLESEISRLKAAIEERHAQLEQNNRTIIALESELKEKQAASIQYESQQHVKVEPLLKEIETMKHREKSWHESKDQLNAMLKQLREKYEMELIGHADDITTLKENTRKYEEMAQKSHQYDHEIRTLKHKLETLQRDHNAKLEHFETASNERMLQQQSVMEQNNILSNHVDSLMKQISTLKDPAASLSMLTTSSTSGANNADDQQQQQQGGSVEELWELIKFLRRDKDILETRLESQKSEAFKYRIKCERLEKGCQSLEASLVAERTMLNDSSFSVEQAMKVNDLELLNGQLKQQVADWEAKCVGVEEKLQAAKCEVEHLSNELSAKCAQFETGSRELIELKRQLAYSENVCNNLKSQLAEVNKKNTDLTTKMSHLQTNRDSNEKSKAEMFNERIKHLSNEIATYKTKLNELAASKVRALADKEAVITSLNNELAELNKNVSSLKDNLSRSISRNHSLHAIATHLKNEITTVKSALATSSTGNDETATQQPPEVTSSEEYIQIDRNLNESKNMNTRLEEEVRRLKQKLSQIQANKQPSTQNIIPAEDYNKLNIAHEALKQKFDTLSKHVSEMSKKHDSSKVVSPVKPVDTSTPMVPIHRRISDGPAFPLPTITSTYNSNGDALPHQKPTINRISPPPSSATKLNAPQSEIATTLVKPSLPNNIDELLSEDREFYEMNNNSSTPVLPTASSDLPSVFSDINPPNDTLGDSVNSASSTSLTPVGAGEKETAVHPKKTPITHPSPNRPGLKRSLVRHKTPILASGSYNLRSSIDPKEAAALQDTLSNKIDSQQSSFVESASGEGVSLDDSHFKRPQKRSMIAMEESKACQRGDIVIDDSDEFEPKKSNVIPTSALDSMPTPVSWAETDLSVATELETPSALFDTPMKFVDPCWYNLIAFRSIKPLESSVINNESNVQVPTVDISSLSNSNTTATPTDTSSRSLKLRRSTFTLESQTSEATPCVSKTTAGVDKQLTTVCEEETDSTSALPEKPKEDSSHSQNEEQ